MKNQLNELITLVSSGCLPEDEISRIADEAARAYADPEAFLRDDPEVNYDDTFTIPLGEWVIIGSLPETVLFQADKVDELYTQIVESFGPDVSFNLRPKQLAKVEPLTALRRIQIQLSAMYPEKSGYVLTDLSVPQDGGLQSVLVYTCDLSRVLELCEILHIKAAPTYEAALARQSTALS